MINENIVKKAYKEYLQTKGSRWEIANSVLYDMCMKYPSHVDENEIVAKIWLIGRSYAAAIERRKNVGSSSGDFYYDVVAPTILKSGKRLDKMLSGLKTPLDSKSIGAVLDTHGFLTSAFKEMTELKKRSLASKYLHFHKPDLFFIYDSRASKVLTSLVKKDKKLVNQLLTNDRDEVYTDFCIRAIQLRDYINKEFNDKLTPRDLDDFLLFVDRN